MRRTIWLLHLLFLALSFWVVSAIAEARPTKGRASAPLPLSMAEPAMASPLPRSALDPAVRLRAASGATITFKTQNGETVNGVQAQTIELPHLVLFRNGVLTNPDERALVVEINDIVVPPAGVTVKLELETQHGNPDLGGGTINRIPVWRVSRQITNTSGITRTGVSTVFGHEFSPEVMSGTEKITTPTDYFRIRVEVMDIDHLLTDSLFTFEKDYAFLMESQWTAQLPEVQEASDGAAPDELMVYYCDMFPFRKAKSDTSTWLRREDVPDYVSTELIPAMVEAFRVQSDDWAFPWYDTWTGYRSGEDAGRLSVALVKGGTWFHGYAPSNGHSGISLRVNGGGYAAGYDSLTDALISVFHHELFHNLQKNVLQHSGDDKDVDGSGGAWRFFSEGTAVLVASVGRSTAEFGPSASTRHYMENANRYLGGPGLERGELNRSYQRMSPYHTALYWRFLYEQCGGMTDGLEDAAAGMDVIRRVFTTLYTTDSTTDLIGSIPEIMDKVLPDSLCPFKTHQESLTAFARAVYALRVDEGRCVAPGTPNGCGFYDPNQLYHEPPVDTITYSGGTISFSVVDQRDPAGIRSSFGMDFVEVILELAVAGKSVTVEFQGTPGAAAVFSVQLWQLGSGGTKPRAITTAPETLLADAEGGYSYTITNVDTATFNRLALIVTRIDPYESIDPVGGYTINLASH